MMLVPKQSFDQALALTRKRILNSPPQIEILRSVEKQLEYLLSIVTGANSDKSRLKDVVLDIYAVREFEAYDPELADALLDAMQYAKILRSGPWSP